MGKKKEVEKNEDKAELMVSVSDFMRTRDNVVSGLTTLQSAVHDLIQTYVRHTNSVLSGTGHQLDPLTIDSYLKPISVAAQAYGNGAVQQPVAPPTEDGQKPKRKRVKKERDPNAPKVPQTAYFLYREHARPIVEKDLGPNATKGDVVNEMLRRWREMPEEEKTMWKDSYKQSRAEWVEAMKKYKASIGAQSPVMAPQTDDEIGSDVDADADAEAAEAEAAEAEEADAEAGAADSDAESSDEEEEEEKAAPVREPSPPAKQPSPPPVELPAVKTPKASKRRKAARENGVSSTAPAAVSAPSPVPLPEAPKVTHVPVPGKTATPESAPEQERERKKKRGTKEHSPEEPRKKKPRKAKGGDDNVKVELVEAPVVEKKDRKRKRKSEGATQA